MLNHTTLRKNVLMFAVRGPYPHRLKLPHTAIVSGVIWGNDGNAPDFVGVARSDDLLCLLPRLPTAEMSDDESIQMYSVDKNAMKDFQRLPTAFTL